MTEQLLSLRSKMILAMLIFCWRAGFSQSPDQSADHAWVITRLAEKFHVQPKNLDDSFSVNLFGQLLKQLDPEAVFFNQKDIRQLETYRLGLDEQIKDQKTDFLRLLTSLYTARLRQGDTIIAQIARKPFDFTVRDSITRTEELSYPADAAAMYRKLFHKMKLAVLSDLLAWDDQRREAHESRSTQQLDSMQAATQKHIRSVYQRDIHSVLQSPGGIKQFVGDAFCKALALCYDPHTMFFPLTEKENFESALGNVRFSFGFSIMENPEGGVLINELKPGSPAFRCGLLNKGDAFLALQWEGQNPVDVSDADVSELAAMLSESNHDKLTITVSKPDGVQRTVTLTKDQAGADEDNKVKSFLLKGATTIGYISLPAFYNDWDQKDAAENGCANDVAREILKLKKDSISGLILDLRYNGGGSIQEAVELAGIFIDAGPVAQISSRLYDHVLTLKDAHRGTAYNGPLILLVNGYSASAAELVAGTLQDYRRALIVGSSTYGKATGQIIVPLDTTIDLNSYGGTEQANDYLKVTTSLLYRINGATVQRTGVTPDIILPDLPDLVPHKEADEAFCLQAAPIAANPYYKPYPALPLDRLERIAGQDLDTLRYFRELKQERQALSRADTNAVSLNWQRALTSRQKGGHEGADTTVFTAAGYTISNNRYDQQTMMIGSSSDDINSTFMDYLRHDPYLKVCYDLLAGMKP